MRALLPLLLVTASLSSSVAMAQSVVDAEPMDDGQAVRQLVSLQSFELTDTALSYDFSAERPELLQGQAIVVAVDPAFAHPKQVKHPVLYAGPIPVQIVVTDVKAGCIVGVIPSAVDLRTQPLYFGSWQLPERVDAVRGAAERVAAIEAGLTPRAATEIDAAHVSDPLVVAGPDALYTALRSRSSACSP